MKEAAMVDETRYQVFVSSTYTDLINERQAVISALLQLGALPAGMELFPAADDEAWVLIRRVIDDSDYYLLVISGRYGSIGKEGLSYTEKEYDYAVVQGKPVMAFLHGNPGKLALDNSEIDPDARVKLSAFRQKVEQAKHVKYWESPEDLAGKIALSFYTFIQTYPAIGWIRADRGDSPEILRKLTTAQEEIAKLKDQLNNRAIEPPTEVKGLADGDELLAIEATIRIQIKNLDPFAGIADRQTVSYNLSISWNEILSALGPSMLDEANQAMLAKRFAETVERANLTQAETVARNWLANETNNDMYLDYYGQKGATPRFEVRITCQDHEFETVLLQFEALGIIEKGTKKRAVADRGIYWTLTPWGRTRLTRLRAVRTGANRPPDKDDLKLEENIRADSPSKDGTSKVSSKRRQTKTTDSE
jgi:hypothetical protein